MPSKNQIKQYIREVRIAHDSRIADSLGGGVISGGGSAGVSVLPTVPATVDGGFWYEVTNNVPMIWLREGNYAYGFNYDTLKFVGETSDALVAYLPFDGSATADACENTWTATGAVSLSTEIKKFGTSSVYLPSGAKLMAQNIIDINADKWTFDAWVYLLQNGYLFTIGGDGQENAKGVRIDQSVFLASNSTSGWAFHTNYTGLTLNEWHHVAVVKDGTSLKLFIDGVLTLDKTLTTTFTDEGVFVLGSITNNSNFYVDNVRFFEGVAIWTSDFTTPTASDYYE